jgi:heme exporter protein A
VALARLLVAERSLWLLDEPTAALDAASQETLLRLIDEHRRKGGIVIATTHQPLALSGARTIRIERPAPDRSASFVADGEGA